MTRIHLLYSPFPSLDAARVAAAALLDARAVACCNLLPGAESHYLWEGKRTVAAETVLIAKTTEKMLANAREILARAHPYACPATLSFPAETGPDYAAWVKNSVSD